MTIGSGSHKSKAEVNRAKNVKITNLDIATADNEESHALQNNLQEVIVRSRVSTTLKVAFESGQSDTTYFTIRKNGVFNLAELDFTGKTLYVQAADVTTLEIIELYT